MNLKDRELDRTHKSWEVLRNGKCIETQRIAFKCPIKYKEISQKKWLKHNSKYLCLIIQIIVG